MNSPKKDEDAAFIDSFFLPGGILDPEEEGEALLEPSGLQLPQQPAPNPWQAASLNRGPLGSRLLDPATAANFSSPASRDTAAFALPPPSTPQLPISPGTPFQQQQQQLQQYIQPSPIGSRDSVRTNRPLPPVPPGFEAATGSGLLAGHEPPTQPSLDERLPQQQQQALFLNQPTQSLSTPNLGTRPLPDDAVLPLKTWNSQPTPKTDSISRRSNSRANTNNGGGNKRKKTKPTTVISKAVDVVKVDKRSHSASEDHGSTAGSHASPSVASYISDLTEQSLHADESTVTPETVTEDKDEVMPPEKAPPRNKNRDRKNRKKQQQQKQMQQQQSSTSSSTPSPPPPATQSEPSQTKDEEATPAITENSNNNNNNNKPGTRKSKAGRRNRKNGPKRNEPLNATEPTTSATMTTNEPTPNDDNNISSNKNDTKNQKQREIPASASKTASPKITTPERNIGVELLKGIWSVLVACCRMCLSVIHILQKVVGISWVKHLLSFFITMDLLTLLILRRVMFPGASRTVNTDIIRLSVFCSLSVILLPPITDAAVEIIVLHPFAPHVISYAFLFYVCRLPRRKKGTFENYEGAESFRRVDKVCGFLLRAIQYSLPFCFLLETFEEANTYLFCKSASYAIQAVYCLLMLHHRLTNSPVAFMGWSLQILLIQYGPSAESTRVLLSCILATTFMALAHTLQRGSKTGTTSTTTTTTATVIANNSSNANNKRQAK